MLARSYQDHRFRPGVAVDFVSAGRQKLGVIHLDGEAVTFRPGDIFVQLGVSHPGDDFARGQKLRDENHQRTP